MKKILVVNPITTDSFNDMTKNGLEKIKSLDVEIEVVNIKDVLLKIRPFQK